MAEVRSEYEKALMGATMPAGKRKVLLAALQLFAKQGFDRTTTAEIAKEAGVSEGLIYKYFKSKDSLLEEIFKSFYDQFRNTFLEGVGEYATLDDLVTAFMRDRLNFARENFALIRIIGQEVFMNPSFIRTAIANVVVNSGHINKYIAEIKAKYPDANPDLNPELLLRGVLGPLFSYALITNLFHLKSDDEDGSLTNLHRQLMLVFKGK